MSTEGIKTILISFPEIKRIVELQIKCKKRIAKRLEKLELTRKFEVVDVEWLRKWNGAQRF